MADGTAATDQYIRLTKIVAIVNASLLLSLVGTWIGLSIATAIQTWQLMKHVRKQRAIPQQPASLQVL